MPEAVPSAVYLLSGGAVPLPLTTMQILTIDLGTDMLPALGLGCEPPEDDVMDRPPRDPKEPLLTGRLMRKAFLWYGLMGGIVSMAAYLFAQIEAGLGTGAGDVWRGRGPRPCLRARHDHVPRGHRVCPDRTGPELPHRDRHRSSREGSSPTATSTWHRLRNLPYRVHHALPAVPGGLSTPARSGSGTTSSSAACRRSCWQSRRPARPCSVRSGVAARRARSPREGRSS